MDQRHVENSWEKSWWEGVATGMHRQDSIASNTLSDVSAMTNISASTTSDPQPVPTPHNPIGITGDYECTAFKIPTIRHKTVWSVLLTLLSEPEIIKRLPSYLADRPAPLPQVPTPPPFLPSQAVSESEITYQDSGTIWPTAENIYAVAGRKRMYFDGHRPVHYWICDMLDGDRTWVPSGYLRSLNN
jgi:hypothetical protein